jgi:predicted CopG family antitoxin
MNIIKLMKELKHITVDKNVYQKLNNLGTAGDSFNDVLTKILSKQSGAYRIDVTGKE